MAKQSRKLNILILCPDQLRADYLSCYGHPTIGTANIDRLAMEGVRLNRAYCAAPLCGPSRISFVTSTRMSEHNHRNYGSTIDYAVPNLVRSLKAAGYKTAMFGKNHCFNVEQLSEIWDELDHVCAGNYDDHPKYKRSFDAFPMENNYHFNLTARLGNEAVNFIKQQRNSGEPYLLWVNWQDPHPAYTCPEPYFSMFDRNSIPLPPKYREGGGSGKPKRLKNWQINCQAAEATDDEIRNARAAYMGQIRYVDDWVGNILDTLDETGQANNTLVIFFSDHGELLGNQGAWHKIGVFYECLVRIPVIIRHPEGLYHGVYEGLVEEVDLAPTILDACGIPKPLSFVGDSIHDRLIEGKLGFEYGRPDALVETGMLAPTWPGPFGKPQKAPFSPNQFGPGAMITDGRFKLSIYYDDTPELYDLENDPEELENQFENPKLREVRERLMLGLCRRILGAGVRDIGDIRWPEEYDDPRDSPLEIASKRKNPSK